MASPEDRERHRKRLKRKVKDRKLKISSPVAKSFEDPKFRNRVVLDKKGRKHNLDSLSYRDLIEAIQEDG